MKKTNPKWLQLDENSTSSTSCHGRQMLAALSADPVSQETGTIPRKHHTRYQGARRPDVNGEGSDQEEVEGQREEAQSAATFPGRKGPGRGKKPGGTGPARQGDFSIICKNLHVLLVGKARDWYWRFRKEHSEFGWSEFCEAIRSHYQDNKDDDLILEEIRSRKQRDGETFDSLYDDVITLVSRMAIPLDEYRLIQQLKRNLEPELRQALLYIQVHSVAHLRQLVQQRENLLGEDDFKRYLKGGNAPKPFFKRAVAAVDLNSTEQPDEEAISDSVAAIQHSNRVITCWNCDEQGHTWDMCLRDRHIFCYGCGAKNIYKPQCPTCIQRAENFRKGPAADSRRMAPK
ncbi:hypothetical protein ACLKA6_014886 [Drosophila palustris]